MPPEALFVIALIAPIVLQWILNFITIRSWWDMHNSTLGGKYLLLSFRAALYGLTCGALTSVAVFLSFSLAGVITQFTKITVGRPRPGTSHFTGDCVHS